MNSFNRKWLYLFGVGTNANNVIERGSTECELQFRPKNCGNLRSTFESIGIELVVLTVKCPKQWIIYRLISLSIHHHTTVIYFCLFLVILKIWPLGTNLEQKSIVISITIHNALLVAYSVHFSIILFYFYFYNFKWQKLIENFCVSFYQFRIIIRYILVYASTSDQLASR